MRFSLEFLLREPHDPPFVLGPHGLEKIGGWRAHVNLGENPVAPQRNGESERFAPAVAGAEKNGRRFPPEPKFQAGIGAQVRVRPGKYHHHACGSAREFRRLVKIRRRMFQAAELGPQSLLEAERVSAVRVILEVAAE